MIYEELMLDLSTSSRQKKIKDFHTRDGEEETRLDAANV